MTTTTNTVQTINETTLSLLQSIEMTAIDLLCDGMHQSEVYENLATMYGDTLTYDLIRMVVNSASVIE